MSSASTGFLVKSIIMLGLVLVLMVVSMFFGKELGRNVMALTESNINQNFSGGQNGAGDENNGDFVIQLENGRGSFDFDPTNFGGTQFPKDWADPPQGEFTAVEEEPAVDITILENTDDSVPEDTIAEETTVEPGEQPTQTENG